MGKFKDYVKDEISKISKEDLDKYKEELSIRAGFLAEILRDCVLLNKNETDSCMTWILALMENVLLLSKAASLEDKDKFDYLVTSCCEQLIESKERMIGEWDNG